MNPPSAASPAPVLKAAIGRLRQMALAVAEGEFLGSEQELRGLLGISRPTFRQAVRMLEQDQLLTKRMGPHGGCYAARPDPQTAARSAALYLQVEQATLQDFMEMENVLQQHALTSACQSVDVGARAAMRDFLARLEEAGDPADLADFQEMERRFEQLVLAMARNPALRLFAEIMRNFVDDNPASQVLIANPAMRRLRCSAWRRLGEAILAGEIEHCLAISREQFDAFVALLPRAALQGHGVRAA